MRASLSLLTSLAFVACGGVSSEEELAQREDAATRRLEHTVAADLSSHDGRTALKAQVQGMTLWAGPQVRAGKDAGRRFTVPFKVSKNLANPYTFVPDDAFGAVNLLSARKAELALDDHELNSLLSGMRIFVSLASQYQGMIGLRPRLTKLAGSRILKADAEIRPILLNEQGELAYRLTLRGDGLRNVVVSTSDGRFEAADTGDGWVADLDYQSLVGSLGDVTITARSSRGSALKLTGKLELLVSQAGLVKSGDAYETWPSTECTAAVKVCVREARSTGGDFGACGDYREAQRCLWSQDPVDDAALRFVEDLRAFLPGWYDRYGRSIEESNGQSLLDAQASVDAAQVTELLEQEEDPNNHDFTQVRVFSHPDVVWPGSDTVWFGAYDRQTGELVEVYSFN